MGKGRAESGEMQRNKLSAERAHAAAQSERCSKMQQNETRAETVGVCDDFILINTLLQFT